MAWVYLQEDFDNWWLSAWDTEDEADEGRRACGEDGDRTTPPVQVPEMDWNVLEEVIRAGRRSAIPAGIDPAAVRALFKSMTKAEIWEG